MWGEKEERGGGGGVGGDRGDGGSVAGDGKVRDVVGVDGFNYFYLGYWIG